MKRSEINRYIADAAGFIDSCGFRLPPFAFWDTEEWKTKGNEYDEIIENQLGWDLTDFGGGDYEKTGLLLFTVRNGNVRNRSCKKTYAEKIMAGLPGQITPYHFHKCKMEDIIHRGGKGALCIQLYASLGPKLVDEKGPVPVAVDGRNYTVPAGTVIRLSPGESITLFQGVFHKFWAEGSRLLMGEVSMVNDDHGDNYFLDAIGRFPEITEDEKPVRLLVGDYAKYTGRNPATANP